MPSWRGSWCWGALPPWNLSALITLQVRSVPFLRLTNTLFRFVGPASLLLPPPLDLSKATKLRDVGFRWDEPEIQWITTSLQTAQLKSLQRVIFTFAAFPLNTTEEKIREWQDLDRLLDRLWTSHSVPSNIVYNDDPGMLAPCLFPELMKRGALYAAQG